MKKLIASILLLTMILSSVAIAIPAEAAALENPVLALTPVDVLLGDTFTTTLYFEKDSCVSLANFTFQYDPEYVELVSCEPNEDCLVSPVIKCDVPGQISISMASGTNLSAKLLLADICFKVSDDLPVGNYDFFALSGDNNYTRRLDGDNVLQDVDLEFHSTKMNLYCAGDINLDGVVDGSDAVYILRYEAGLSSGKSGSKFYLPYYENVEEYDEHQRFILKVADAHFDGGLDGGDAVSILRHEVGFEEKIGNYNDVVFYDKDGNELIRKPILEGGSLKKLPEVPMNDDVAGSWSLSATEYIAPVLTNITELTRIYPYYPDNKCEHFMQYIAARAATCTKDGNIEYWYCGKCELYFSDKDGKSEIFSEDTVVKAKGHTVVIDEEVPATYESFGLTEGSHCSVCGTVIVSQTQYGPLDPEDEIAMFWITHYNDNTVEGAGSIFTETYTGASWWLNVAFKPVAGTENGWEVVGISNGLDDGNAVPLAIPENGFVWAANYGYDYIAIGMGDTDFTNSNCSDAISRATAWKVGDRFVITGLDLEGKKVPTTTPELNWYDDDYVCTATFFPLIERNLALGKNYTKAGLMANGSFPDEDGKSLTDGEKHPVEESFSAPEWAGFSIRSADCADLGYAWIRVDLDETCKLSKAVITCATQKFSTVGLKGLKSVIILVSDDGVNFTEAGRVEDITDTSEIHYHDVEVAMNGASGRYVEYRFTGLSNLMFISEVEVYGTKVKTPKEPEDETEKIVVDGKLDDSGWISDKWTGVTEENGMMQIAATEGNGANYKFQMRTDDEYLYVGAVLGTPAKEGGNGKGTTFRIWVRTDETASVFTHIYEVKYLEGKVACCGYVNPSKTGNKMNAIEASSIEAGLTTDSEKTYVEFKVKLTEFGGENGFNCFVSYGDNPNNEGFFNIFYPQITIGSPSRIANLPFVAWETATQLFVDPDEIRLGKKEQEPEFKTYEERIAAKVGEPNESAKFDLNMEAELGEDGKTVTLTVNIDDIEGQLSVIMANICFDADRLTLTTAKDKDGIILFTSKGFNDNWENELTHMEEDGEIIFFYMNPRLEELMDDKGDYSIEFTFELKEGYGEAGFWIASESVEGANETMIGAVTGNGSFAIVKKVSQFPLIERNLALNKSYTTAALYQDKYHPDAPNYPDEEGKSLTDGVAAPGAGEGGYSNPIWAGFNIGSGDYKELGYAWINVDLGEVKGLTHATLYSATSANGNGAAGIKSVNKVSIYVSEDGKNYKLAGEAIAVDSETDAYVAVDVKVDCNARYVEFRFTKNSNWMYVSEVEVYGTKDPEDETYEEQIAAKVGEPNESAKFDLNMEAELGEDGKTVTLTIHANNIKEELYIVACHLCFDAERLKVLNEINKDNLLQFESKGFSGHWSNDTTHLIEDGVIEFAYLNAYLDGCMDSSGEYSFELSFELADGFDEAGFWIPNETVEGGGSTSSWARLSGNGSYVVVKKDTQEPELDEYAKTIVAKVGESNENSKVNLNMEAELGEDGKTVTLAINLDNIEGQISLLMANIYFDAERLTLTTPLSEDGESVILFGSKGFTEDWENELTHMEIDGEIIFSIMNPNLKNLINKDGEYSIEFTFELKDGFDEAGLWIPSETVEGFGFDSEIYSIFGNGSYVIVKKTDE